MQAQSQNFTYPRYAWIAYDWYPKRWWAFEESNVEVSCSESQLAEFLDKVISFRWRPVPDDRNATTDSGIVSQSLCLYEIFWISYVTLATVTCVFCTI